MSLHCPILVRLLLSQFSRISILHVGLLTVSNRVSHHPPGNVWSPGLPVRLIFPFHNFPSTDPLPLCFLYYKCPFGHAAFRAEIVLSRWLFFPIAIVLNKTCFTFTLSTVQLWFFFNNRSRQCICTPGGGNVVGNQKISKINMVRSVDLGARDQHPNPTWPLSSSANLSKLLDLPFVICKMETNDNNTGQGFCKD